MSHKLTVKHLMGKTFIYDSKIEWNRMFSEGMMTSKEKCTIRVCKRSFTREAEDLAMSVKRKLSPE